MKRRTLRAWKILRILLLAYLGVCLLIALFQRTLMYPGRSTQGQPEAAVREQPGMELIRLGETVAAYFPAKDSDAPTVLFFYGNGDCLAYFLPFADELRHRGLGVAVMEYPGYGVSDGSMTERQATEAAVQLHDALTARGIDPDRLVVAGVSLGGGVAVDLATKRPVAGVATFSTFTSMSDMARRIVPIVPPFLVIDRYDNRAKLPAIKAPLFLVHGTADTLIPYAMAAELEAAAGGEVTRYPVAGAGHNDLFQIGGPALWDDLSAWVRMVTH